MTRLQRVHIHLSDAELELLDRISNAAGDSRSELIRRAIGSTFSRANVTEPRRAKRLEALRASAGSWADFPLTGAEYVDAIRGDFNDRLRRLDSD